MRDGVAVDVSAFKRCALVYPQPVAASCGRILRAVTPQEQIDAYLKAAEVLTRYVCALALSSLSSRDAGEIPSAIIPPKGDLSFGKYLSLVQTVAKVSGHPLEAHLGAFRPRGNGKNESRGKADAPLVALLELRNKIGHDLATLQKARALTLLSQHEPGKQVTEALGALEGILGLPLFVFDNQRLENRQPVAQRLLLMGESADPMPDNVHLTEPLDDLVPYVALGREVLSLTPAVIFSLIEEQSAYRLAFLDGVKEDKLHYKTLESRVFELTDAMPDELEMIFSGKRRTLDEVGLADGRTFGQEWRVLQASREDAGQRADGLVPWDSYDPDTLSWYASRLPAEDDGAPEERITLALLDGRIRGLGPEELRQLGLLFGAEREARTALGRDLYDFRLVTEPGARWDERSTGATNILVALREAVKFVATHVGIGSAEADDLTKTSGSADYIAMREALVNQFIHQDYSDATASAQVELSPNYAVFFNTGHSLVSDEHLTDGGKSQARNPLIARALRLIGYAELAGSGIRALQYQWREAKRRPPIVESDQTGNTFSLTLDWREVPDAYDKVWKEKLGVQLTAEKAAILNLATDPAGISEHQAAAGTGVRLAEAKQALRFLVNQVLLDEHDGRYHLQPHLKEALQ